MIVIASSGGRASFPHGWHSTVQRLRLPRRLSESLAENLCDNDAAEIRLANVPAPPISLELKEMGGAVIVPQRSGRGWRSPAAAGRTAGRPIVSYGFVGIAFVSVSRLCPYRASYYMHDIVHTQLPVMASRRNACLWGYIVNSRVLH